MKTLLDANKQYIETSREKKEAQKEDDSNPHSGSNVTNNTLILTTDEALKMIKNNRTKNE